MVLDEREGREAIRDSFYFEPNQDFKPSGVPSWARSLLRYAGNKNGCFLLPPWAGLGDSWCVATILSIVFIDYVLVQVLRIGYQFFGQCGVLAVLQFLLSYLQQTITMVFQTRLSIALK